MRSVREESNMMLSLKTWVSRGRACVWSVFCSPTSARQQVVAQSVRRERRNICDMPGVRGRLRHGDDQVVTRTRRVMNLWKDIKVPCKVVHVPMTPMTCAHWYFFDLIFKYFLVGFTIVWAPLFRCSVIVRTVTGGPADDFSNFPPRRLPKTLHF